MAKEFRIDIDRTEESEDFTQRINYLGNKTMELIEAENITPSEATVLFSIFLKRIVIKGRP